jgi:hypothetical protein
MGAYICLSIYILSVLLSGLLIITGVKMRPAFLFMLVLHVLAGFAALVHTLLPGIAKEISILKYAFLCYLCSGLLAGGLYMRTDGQRIVKAYFSLLFLSLAVFIYSPSRFITLLVPGEYGPAAKRFPVHSNYFLEPQRSLVRFEGKKESYKLVQEFGLFHKTIRRDIQFEGVVDSLRTLETFPDKVLLRIYLHRDSTGTAIPDTMELNLSLIPDNNTEIIHKSP